LLLSIPAALGVSQDGMVGLAIFLGALWLAASVLLLVRIFSLAGYRSVGYAASALWVSSGFTWYCLLSGMETGLYVTLLLGVIAEFLRWSRREASRQPLDGYDDLEVRPMPTRAFYQVP
jgi:hypothetical protein